MQGERLWRYYYGYNDGAIWTPGETAKHGLVLHYDGVYNYLDSKDMINKCRYNYALDFYNSKEYEKALDYFIGQVMKKTRGKANPTIAYNMMKEKLDNLKK